MTKTGRSPPRPPLPFEGSLGDQQTTGFEIQLETVPHSDPDTPVTPPASSGLAPVNPTLCNLTAPGDLDGDGTTDFVVGCPWADGDSGVSAGGSSADASTFTHREWPELGDGTGTDRSSQAACGQSSQRRCHST